MSDDFRFGDPRARDDMGGCCGKPIGCQNESQGCVRKKDKRDWQEKAAAQAEEAAQTIERRDRYTIVVDGHAIRATDDQERRIRTMDAEQRARFLTVMGRTTSEADA